MKALALPHQVVTAVAILRIVGAVLGLLGAVLLEVWRYQWRATRGYGAITKARMRVFVMLMHFFAGLFLAIAYGYIESVAQTAPPGLRVLFSLAFLACIDGLAIMVVTHADLFRLTAADLAEIAAKLAIDPAGRDTAAAGPPGSSGVVRR